MKERLKRRLTGAIVLVSLAVIFVPMLLDGRRADDQLVAGIPQRDAGPFDERLAHTRPDPIVPITPPPAVEPDALPPAAAVADVRVPEPAQTPRPAAAAPQAAADVAPQPLKAWIIQVGSFSKADNANEVASRLRAEGFDTVIQQARVNGSTVYRVQVGPESDKGRADAMLERIRSKLQLEGRVHTYPSS